MDDSPTCLAPDLPTREPRFRLPQRACDAHCHVLGPTDRYPYARQRRYTPWEAPLEQLERLHAVLGVQRAVLVNASCYGCDNRVTTDAIAQGAGRYRGVASIDESFDQRALQRLHAQGIRGVRVVHEGSLGLLSDLAELSSIARRIEPFGWHIDLLINCAALPELAPILRQLPVPFVIDHMGLVSSEGGLEQPPFRQLLQLLQSTAHCWVKLSGIERISSAGPPFTDALPFAQALLATAPERLVWGGDWPHVNLSKRMPNDADLVDLIPLMAPDAHMQRRILVDNPQRLYGFDDAD